MRKSDTDIMGRPAARARTHKRSVGELTPADKGESTSPRASAARGRHQIAGQVVGAIIEVVCDRRRAG